MSHEYIIGIVYLYYNLIIKIMNNNKLNIVIFLILSKNEYNFLT